MEFNQDQILLLVREQDMLKRMDNGQKLIDYLSNLEGNLKWDNVDRVIDSLSMYWVASSNYKVALLGLDIISLLVERLQDEFQSHYNSVQNALVDRLGDQKEQVRSASVTLFTNIMDAAANPQFVFDRLTSVFSHKVWRVRGGICTLLMATLNRFGACSLSLSKIVPHVCKLLSDPNEQVREVALTTLTEIYRHVGDKVKHDIMKRGIPQNRLLQVLDRFDEVSRSGEMEVDGNETASVTSSGSFGSVGSTTVNSSSSYMKPPETSYVPNNHRASSATTVRTPASHDTRATRTSTARRPGLPTRSGGTEAGAVDDETFLNSMEKDLPTVRLYNARDFEECMNKIQTVLSDEKKDWEERSKTLKMLRAVIANRGAEYDSFDQHIRTLEPALRLNTKDLRSQVVRETCLTIAHLSTVMTNRFDHTAEALFPILFNLVPNSAKVMASSGVATIRIILRNTQAPRLIPVITGNCFSKSTAVRKGAFGFLDLVLQEWQTSVLEKQLALLIEAVKRGISDADSEARTEARKSWWGLHCHFPAEAEKLFNELTSSQQKMVQGQVTASSSTDSIPRSTASESHVTSKRPPSSSRHSLLPNTAQRVPTGRASRIGNGADRAMAKKFSRSRSEIDTEAAKKSALKAMSYHSIGRQRPTTSTTATGRVERKGRNDSRPATSQPGSRSHSPNSRSKYYSAPRTPTGTYKKARAHTMSAEDSPDHDYPRRVATPGSAYSNGAQRAAKVSTRTPPSSLTNTPKSRIPVSTSRSGSRAGSRVGSRVGSPSGSRGSSPHRYRASKRGPLFTYGPRSEPVSRNHSRVTSSQVSSRDSSPGCSGRGSTSSNSGYGASGPPLRVLPKGREGELVLSDALFGRKTPKRRGESNTFSDNDDDFSDTSSVYSDRSSSYQSSRNGGKRTLSRARTEDIAEILTLCQNTNWAERKEGLLSLHCVVKKEKPISRMEMKKILEIFNRMFADPHGKVFSLFLEILPDFVATYKESIEEWLYVLMTQLLKKMGADLLGSVQAKVIKAMQTTRVSFSPKQQFLILTRYIVDQTQTPNLKVKVALLHYLLELIAVMDSIDLNSTAETRLAISRMITWTTEPKSQDVRKAAESVIAGLFELNPGEFSIMLRVLPKTFQDGAMKVLHTHVKPNGDIKEQHPTSSYGRVTARVGVSPAGQVVSPHGSTSGLADVMSPRGSDMDYPLSDRSGADDMEETLNFGDITAEIHKLRLDSSVDVPDCKQEPYGSSDVDSPPQVCHPPPLQQLQNTPNQLSTNRGTDTKYNLGIYSDKTINPPPYNREALREAMFDDDDDEISDEFSQREASVLTQLTLALQKKSQRKAALMDFRKALRSGDTKLFLSGRSYQWENYFVPLLMHVLECAKDEEAETRGLALAILKEMFLRISWDHFSDYIETIIYSVLEAHKDRNADVVRTAEDTTATLGKYLPPDLCFQVLIPFLDSDQPQTTQAAIKMLTNAIGRAQKEDLSQKIANDIVPCLIKGYDSTESSMRKAAVFCLVAIHQVIGEEELQKHLSSLSGSKMKLLQLYIKRAQASTH